MSKNRKRDSLLKKSSLNSGGRQSEKFKTSWTIIPFIATASSILVYITGYS